MQAPGRGEEPAARRAVSLADRDGFGANQIVGRVDVEEGVAGIRKDRRRRPAGLRPVADPAGACRERRARAPRGRPPARGRRSDALPVGAGRDGDDWCPRPPRPPSGGATRSSGKNGVSTATVTIADAPIAGRPLEPGENARERAGKPGTPSGITGSPKAAKRAGIAVGVQGEPVDLRRAAARRHGRGSGDRRAGQQRLVVAAHARARGRRRGSRRRSPGNVVTISGIAAFEAAHAASEGQAAGAHGGPRRPPCRGRQFM